MFERILCAAAAVATREVLAKAALLCVRAASAWGSKADCAH